jgi:hypothetical protein
MTRSWAYGAGLVLGMHLLWFVLIFTEAHADWVMPAIIVLFFVTMNIAGLAAFVTAWRAPRHPLPLALSMAPLTAVLATLSNLMLDAAGTHVDLSGFRGNLGLFGISLTYGIFVSLVGGGIGIWLARRTAPPAVSVPVEPAPTPNQ